MKWKKTDECFGIHGILCVRYYFGKIKILKRNCELLFKVFVYPWREGISVSPSVCRTEPYVCPSLISTLIWTLYLYERCKLELYYFIQATRLANVQRNGHGRTFFLISLPEPMGPICKHKSLPWKALFFFLGARIQYFMHCLISQSLWLWWFFF